MPAALAAAEALAVEGIEASVWDMRWAKPLDEEAVRAAAAAGVVVTVEEGSTIGGVGEGVLEVLSRAELSPAVRTLGLPDAFSLQGDVSLLLRDAHLDAEAIASAVGELRNL